MMHLLSPPRPIQVLDPSVVERIAAGEVIERPVSLVRELLDNALDAGASEIRLDVRGGGLRSIRVSDNGCGIPPEQVELAIRHHATSKIRDAADLAQVASLGFRGEALPSIAAVSELSLVTAVEGGGPAVRLDVRYGEILERSLCARTRGTTVTVRNLFSNLPARLKFMGNARAESSLIGHMVRRYALAHPEVHFTLALDGHTSLHTSGGGLEQTLGEVFGPAIAAAMVPMERIEVEQAAISGRLTQRHVTRSSRHHLTLLVNGRLVSSRTLLAALEDGYRPLLPRGRHPIGLITVDLPRANVDVNVHPSKAEVKIAGEAGIAAVLRATVRETLGRSLSQPAPDARFALGPLQAELPRMVAEEGPSWELATAERLRSSTVQGQVHGALILLEDAQGIYLVDQHRAHERAIYEHLLRQHAEGRAGQLLLEPLHVELNRYQLARLEPRLPELAALGFSCEWFGGRSFLVRSVPVLPESNDLPGLLDDLLDLAASGESDWQHRLLTSVACRTATRRGKPLTTAQCRELVHLLAGTESPAVCPHGSPIILQLSDQFLHRQFDW